MFSTSLTVWLLICLLLCDFLFLHSYFDEYNVITTEWWTELCTGDPSCLTFHILLPFTNKLFQSPPSRCSESLQQHCPFSVVMLTSKNAPLICSCSYSNLSLPTFQCSPAITCYFISELSYIVPVQALGSILGFSYWQMTEMKLHHHVAAAACMCVLLFKHRRALYINQRTFLWVIAKWALACSG